MGMHENFMEFEWEKIDMEKVNALAIEAGRKIMEIYADADFSKIVDYKSDNSPLTLADKESNKIIEEGLAKIAPIPFLSEEGNIASYSERQNWDCFWLVDPLDGTKEFIKKNGQFTVNIALVKIDKPVLGVIYAPAFDDLYYAKKNEGAFKRKAGKTNKLITSDKKNKWIAIGSSSHSSPEEENILKKYPVTENTAIGSSLKFCLLAEGKADIYYRHGPTMEWDIAAGQIILECSGGIVLNEKKEEFAFNKPSLKNGSFLCLANKKNKI
jgi:3'(2'), 5'-bisphosphate nucleotidase